MATAKKRRVLECIRQGQIGGGESHLLSLVENLDRTSFEPVVLSFTDGPMIERLQEMGVKSHVIYTERPFDFTKWRSVRKLMKKEQIELVHAHGTRANSNVLWAARSLNIPVVYTVHGWSFHRDQHPLLRSVRVCGEKYLTAKASVNISVSDSNKQSGKEYIPEFESVVINNGIDQKKFSPARELKDIRKELNISPEVKLVLFVARFTLQKQPLLLIEAFHQALATVPDMHLLMIGDGDQKQEAVALTAKLSIADKISFQSFRQDVPDVLAAADIFVLPSLWEGLPIGLLEAMAMSKAIIASRVDGTSEVIKDRENGLLVEPGNSVALTEALVELCRKDDLRKRMQENALATVKERFNAETMTRQIENVYNNLLNGKGL